VLLRGRDARRRSFLLLLASVGLTLLTTGLVLLAADAPSAAELGRVSQAGVALTPACGIEFARALTGRRLRWLRSLGWTLGPAVSALSLFTPWMISAGRPYPYGFAAVAGPLYPIALAVMSLSVAVPVVIGQARAIERRPREREQLFVVLLSSWIAALALIDILPVLGIDAPPLGWLPLIIAAAGLLVAIVRYRLFDVRLALRRSFGWLGLTIVGAAPLVAFTAAFGPRLGAGRPLGLALLFAALALVMRGYLRTIQPRLDRLFGGRGRDIDDELAAFANQAATLQTPADLGRAVDRFLAALDRRLAALVVIDEKGRPKVALSAWGAVPPPSRSSPLLAELAQARTLVGRDERGPAHLEIERACVRWGADYLAPLVEGDALIGLIAVSPRQGGGVADAMELEAIERLGVTVTAALASARLYERLQALSSELEEKAEARSASLAKTLRELRGAEARLVEGAKLASLGHIVGGVAADLGAEVKKAFSQVASLRADAEVLLAAAERARHSAPDPAPGGDRFDEMARDLDPLIDAISEGARRAHAIAQDLARFAPDDAPSAPGRARAPAHLAALIDSTLTLVTGQLAEVSVVRDYDERLPAIPVEVGPLGQVILNLILNATQAMKGSGTLTLSTRLSPEHAELAVADTGPGIPAEVLPRIFEPFFSTKGPTTGTGLGLSICHGIVQRHGGQIHVESTPGAGTTFRVQLPLA
jgi:signal transduction histidine kinase